ncbi:MAG: SAM-dependent methyltransferase, partial [Parvibaculum sp.]
GVALDLRLGFARDAAQALPGGATKVVSSLVFHQVPMVEKRAGLAAMYASLVSGGEAHIADYGLQRTSLMRQLFKQIQRLDGVENTTPNAEGVLPTLMSEAGFIDVEEASVISTPTGSISLYFGRKPKEQRSAAQ